MWGGGCKNKKLNQITADITGKTVIAGPEEATSLGNIGVQLKKEKPDLDLLQIRKLLQPSILVMSFTPVAEKKAINKINDYYSSYEALF